MDDRVVLINAFQVPEGHAETFLGAWERVREHLKTQPGYRSSSLHRSLTPEALYPFVNVAEWETPALFQQAMSGDRFQALAGDPGGVPLPSGSVPSGPALATRGR